MLAGCGLQTHTGIQARASVSVGHCFQDSLKLLKSSRCSRPWGAPVQCLQSLMEHTSAVKCLSSRVGVV